MPFPLFVFISSAIAATTLTATLLLSRWHRLAVASAFVGGFGLLVFHGPGFFNHFPVDDAYIIFRYSKNLAEGLGPNWNSEGRVEGYTSFVWMALPAAVSKLGIDLIEGARVLIFLSQLGTFAVVYRIWKLWADDHPGSGLDSPLLLAAILIAIAATDGVAFWGFSGMETPLFMFVLTAGAYLYFRERRGVPYPWSAVAFAAAAMTRPEGLIAAAVTGTFTLARVIERDDRRRALLGAAVWAGAFLLLYGSYFLWRYNYYDYLLPNTFYAKVGPTSDVFERGFKYLSDAALRYHLLLMFAGTATLLTLQRLRTDAEYILAVSSAMLLGIAFEGGDAFDHGRFIAPLLPLIYAGGLAGLSTLLKRLPFPPAQGALVAALILTFGGLTLLQHSDDPGIPGDRERHVDRRVLGLWLREHTPEHYTVAAFAVGSLAYHSERDILDMFGLNDVVIARTDIPNFGSGLAGHEKYNPDYVLGAVRPEIIVISDADSRPLSTEEFRQRHTDPPGLPAKRTLLGDPRLWEQYQVRSLLLEGRWFNFLQRKDTVAELQAPGLH